MLPADNRNEMAKLQDKLNASTKPKRDNSFHADQPRKAAVKAKEGMTTGLAKTKAKKESSARSTATGKMKNTPAPLQKQSVSIIYLPIVSRSSAAIACFVTFRLFELF